MRIPALRRRSAGALAAGAALAVVAAGAAVAAIPNPDGSISGCFSKRNGALKIIDPAAAACASNETAVSLASTDADGKVANADKLDGLDASQLRGIAYETSLQHDYDLAQGECETMVADLPEGIAAGRPVVVGSNAGFGYGESLILNNGITQFVGESTKPLITWTACNMGAGEIPTLTITLAVLS